MSKALDKDLAVKAMVVMRKAFRTIDAYVSESYKVDDLTPAQFGVLDVLNSKGTLSIGELINSMLATSGNMTVVIKNMENKGWVTRTVSPNDRRSFLVDITPEGKRIIQHNLPLHKERVREVFATITEDQQAQLISILKEFKDFKAEEKD